MNQKRWKRQYVIKFVLSCYDLSLLKNGARSEPLCVHAICVHSRDATAVLGRSQACARALYMLRSSCGPLLRLFWFIMTTTHKKFISDDTKMLLPVFYRKGSSKLMEGVLLRKRARHHTSHRLLQIRSKFFTRALVRVGYSPCTFYIDHHEQKFQSQILYKKHCSQAPVFTCLWRATCRRSRAQHQNRFPMSANG